ncbi:MAG: type I DNA topoisomerase [Mediterranea sp.]|jgi:DNA topoisomerase-1|nr:type I DNA topoisomerase [Mediterranea sp.]
MKKNLVIVESPAKAKTIEKFLGKDFKVLSSYGHVRDLKKTKFSIDVDNHFAPTYIVPTDKKKVVNELKLAAEEANMVWLASDEDREGEAIAWHLYEVLKLCPERTKRIVFHEITKPAILKAIETPRDIDIDLVNAQQARRVLDRIVGFELSPVLWKKVKHSLSAGRVQSVAVRLIAEREKEIQAFNSEASYRVSAIFTVPGSKGKTVELKTELTRRFKSKEEARRFLESCQSASFTIEDIATRPLTKSAAAPFTTSTLQQEAARKLNYTVSQTMMAAQRLYESGKITYMRTDSVNLSDLAIQGCKEVITKQIGEEYLKSRQYTTKTKGAQEAHEAIRPTSMDVRTIETSQGSHVEAKLYDLIWKRTIASQMADAKLEKTTITIGLDNTNEKFAATGEVIKFDGFLHVYKESHDDDDDEPENEGKLLPPVEKGQMLEQREVSAVERFTQRPPRYTEASLVRKMEELGIGRPSTYAPTISTIQQRKYIEKNDREGTERSYNVLLLKDGKIADTIKKEIVGTEKSKLFPTDIGLVTNRFLTEYFPNILDFNFTASVEKEFDEIAEGAREWPGLIEEFYKGFHPLVEEIMAGDSGKAGERTLGTDPVSGKELFAKIGRYGPIIQLGVTSVEEKPRFISLRKGQSIETITMEEALELFKLPRRLSDYEGKELTVNIGRYGPYAFYDGKFVALPKTCDPMVVTDSEVIEVIKAKRKSDAERTIKTFDEEPDLRILTGRFGAYITYKGANYKIPKTTVPQDLTLEGCMELIEQLKKKAAGKTTSKKTRSPKKTDS